MAEFNPKPTMGPPSVKGSASSNNISDQYRDRLVISYQYIGNVEPKVSFRVGSRTIDMPIMVGPVGGWDRVNEEKTMGAAKAAAAAGTVFWDSFHDKEGHKALLDAGLPIIRTIKPLADNGRLLEEIAFDTENGAWGYAMDIDHGFDIYGRPDHQQEQFASKTVEDFRILAEASPLPFYLKGVMSVHDALAAADAGVTGIVISGHNNRFPCAIPPLKILPAIREAVGDRLTILVDGGMNTGYEAFKAIALGADGILTARAALGAYAKEGPDGLTYKLLEMNAELKGAMANTGSPDLQHINRASVTLL